MAHLVDQHVIINGTRITHGVHGDGEPVVLLHGTPSSSYIWRNILPTLVEAGYKVHVYDLLGYGLSERPQDPSIDTPLRVKCRSLKGYLMFGASMTSTSSHMISAEALPKGLAFNFQNGCAA